MRIVSREAWLAERKALLAREKAATRELDALAKARQALPWVAVEADYTFQSEIGLVSFESLFAGRSQLLIYHFLFGPDWSEPCDGCSAWASALNGTLDQIYKHDANLVWCHRRLLTIFGALKRRVVGVSLGCRPRVIGSTRTLA